MQLVSQHSRVDSFRNHMARYIIALFVSLPCFSIGLIVASIVVDLTGAAQPALLYLVPSTLIPILLKAIIQVHVYTFEECASRVRRFCMCFLTSSG